MEVIGLDIIVFLAIMEKFLIQHSISANVSKEPNGMAIHVPKLMNVKVVSNGMYFLLLVNAQSELSGMAHIVLTKYLVTMEEYPTIIMNVFVQTVHIG